MGWLWATLLPHPPIIIPEVGAGRQKSAEATIRGMKTIINRLSSTNDNHSMLPERIFILSPHQPYAPNMLFANMAPTMSGSFGRFNAGNVQLQMANDTEAFESLVNYISQHVPVGKGSVTEISEDQGTLVPLYFFEKAWRKLPEIYCFNPSGLTLQQAQKLGEALRHYEDGARWGFLASGDLSHRLTPDAPAGYNPAGKTFDKAILSALMEGSTEPILTLPSQTLHDAGECGCRSVFALLGLSGGPVKIISYEGPFGVGYCTALKIFGGQEKMDSANGGAQIQSCLFPQLARMGISSFLTEDEIEGDVIMESLGNGSEKERQLLQSPGACFVTIKNLRGELRGCIGTILPTRETLLEEIIGNAIAAASRDPRFPPLGVEEFDNISVSVDLLSQPEPVEDTATLDPAVYGVIVSKDNKRGLLLPDLEGVDTVERQLSIAASKAGLANLEGASIFRFTVERFHESA